MHGLARGEIRKRAGEMDVYQSTAGEDSIYPDGLITKEALNQLRRLGAEADEQPFFLAVGLIRPHLPFGAPARYYEPYADAQLPPIPHPQKPSGRTTWHRSGEFMKYNRWGRNPNQDPEFATLVRRHYAACVSYADAQVGRLIAELEAQGLRAQTRIVLWGDHGWHLGEHAIWGKHALFEESLRSPLIIVAPEVEQPGSPSRAIVESIDLFPTLCELAGLPAPAGLHGRSLLPLLRDPDASGRPAVSYTAAQTIRTDRFRLIEHRDGAVELYDHDDPRGETANVAEQHPRQVERLRRLLKDRLADR
jgi:iduronate 2-sulfatase